MAVEKASVGKKLQTTVTATAAGRRALARHVATLQEIKCGAAVVARGGYPLSAVIRERREATGPVSFSRSRLPPMDFGDPLCASPRNGSGYADGTPD